MNPKRTGYVLGLLVAASFVLSACGASAPPATPAAGAAQPGALAPGGSTPAAALGGEVAAAGEAAGGEAALVIYQDASQHFSVAHPANWSQDPTVTAGVKFKGADGSMELHFVAMPSGTLAAYAQQDTPGLASAYPGVKLLGITPSPDIPHVVIQGFEATGQSAVTGKAYVEHGDRYYMPLADGRLAVLTVLGPAGTYDPQGVRDTAITLKVTK